MGVVENMKDVADLIKKFGDIDLNRRILKLEEEVIDLSRDKRRAEEKVEALESELKIRKQPLPFALAAVKGRPANAAPYGRP